MKCKYVAGYSAIHYLHKSHNTPLLPPNNGYAKVLGGNRGVLWDCANSEYQDAKLVFKLSRKLAICYAEGQTLEKMQIAENRLVEILK